MGWSSLNPDPEAELSGKIAVKWINRKKQSRILYERCLEGKLNFEMKEIGIGGFFNPEALPLLHTPFENSLALRPAFSVGDRVCIDPQIQIGHEGLSKELEEVLMKNSYFIRISFNSILYFS